MSLGVLNPPCSAMDGGLTALMPQPPTLPNQQVIKVRFETRTNFHQCKWSNAMYPVKRNEKQRVT
eukprot:973983-Pelagomonas_calceolata.AAC.7